MAVLFAPLEAVRSVSILSMNPCFEHRLQVCFRNAGVHSVFSVDLINTTSFLPAADRSAMQVLPEDTQTDPASMFPVPQRHIQPLPLRMLR